MTINVEEARALLGNLYCCRQYAVMNGQRAQNLARYAYGVEEDRDAWRAVAMEHETELKALHQQIDGLRADTAQQIGMALAMAREGL